MAVAGASRIGNLSISSPYNSNDLGMKPNAETNEQKVFLSCAPVKGPQSHAFLLKSMAWVGWVMADRELQAESNPFVLPYPPT